MGSGTGMGMCMVMGDDDRGSERAWATAREKEGEQGRGGLVPWTTVVRRARHGDYLGSGRGAAAYEKARACGCGGLSARSESYNLVASRPPNSRICCHASIEYWGRGRGGR